MSTPLHDRPPIREPRCTLGVARRSESADVADVARHLLTRAFQISMRSLRNWTFLPAALASSCSLVACGATDTDTTSPFSAVAQTHEDLETARISAVLDQRYTANDVRHSFLTKFGETIDCIDFFAQRGVKRLAELGRPITELPPAQPIDRDSLPDDAFNGKPDQNGAPRECPEGTVPMLRYTVDDVKAMGGLEALRRMPHKAHPPAPPATCALTPELDEYAHVIQDYPAPNSPSVHVQAATAVLNIAGPSVPTTPTNDHSLAQVWMTAGCGFQYQDQTCEGTDCIESVEVGWDVDPTYLNAGRPKPSAPHLFIFSTNDGYATGCYDGDSMFGTCDDTWIGAPQSPMALGMTLTASIPGSTQTELALRLSVQSPSWGNGPGWLIEWSANGAGNTVPLGYYPSTGFHNQMVSTGDTFQVGGEILDATDKMVVPMGSGASASLGFGKAAYVHDFAASTTESGWTENFYVTGVTEPAGKPLDYAMSTTPLPKPGGGWGNYFYFGEANFRYVLALPSQALRFFQSLFQSHLITTTSLNIGSDGAAYARLFQSGAWGTPSAISAASFAPSGANMATGAVSSTKNATFVVGSDGKVDVSTQTNGGAWPAFSALTAASFAKPGANLVTGTPTGPLSVFFVDTAGKLESITATAAGGWGAPVALTAAGFAPSGASLATGKRANGEFDVFAVGTDGTLKYEFYNIGIWGGPLTLTSSGFAPPGAPIGTALDVHGFFNVMVVGNTGALYTDWDVTPSWSGATALTATGFAPAGAGVSAINFNNTSINVFLADNAGNVDTLSNTGTGWTAPTAIAPSATTAGAAISTVLQGTNELDVFTTTPSSPSGVIESIDIGGTWSPPVTLP